MIEKRYIISDAAKLIEVESHVLRYWEDELDIEIPRNEMGHRYYTDFYITLFKNVKELKDKGFQLKAIKLLLPDMMGEEQGKVNSVEMIKSELSSVVSKEQAYMRDGAGNALTKDTADQSGGDKVNRFKQLLHGIVYDAMRDNNEHIYNIIEDNGKKVSDAVIKEMDYLLRLKDEQEEERFKKFDEVIRNYQRSTKEAAAGNAAFGSEKKKRRLFGKKK